MYTIFSNYTKSNELVQLKHDHSSVTEFDVNYDGTMMIYSLTVKCKFYVYISSIIPE